MRGSFLFVFCRHYTKAAESRFHIFTLPYPRDGATSLAQLAGRGMKGEGTCAFYATLGLLSPFGLLVVELAALRRYPL
jgi:hypothetical protein